MKEFHGNQSNLFSRKEGPRQKHPREVSQYRYRCIHRVGIGDTNLQILTYSTWPTHTKKPGPQTVIACGYSHAKPHIVGLVQERHSSSSLAMELRLSCSNPSICKIIYVLPLTATDSPTSATRHTKINMTKIITSSDAVPLTFDPWPWKVDKLEALSLYVTNLRTIHRTFLHSYHLYQKQSRWKHIKIHKISNFSISTKKNNLPKSTSISKFMDLTLIMCSGITIIRITKVFLLSEVMT